VDFLRVIAASYIVLIQRYTSTSPNDVGVEMNVK